AMQKSSAAPPVIADAGPAHGLLRIRAENWNDVLPDFRLGWAEHNRQACLKNLAVLSNAARALVAQGGGEVTAESREALSRQIHQFADRLYAVHHFCPDDGQYVLAADGKQ